MISFVLQVLLFDLLHEVVVLCWRGEVSSLGVQYLALK